MKRILLMAILAASQLTALSQYSLKGTINDSNSQALPGATIKVLDTYLGTVADKDGLYEIPGLKSGEYRIQVSFLGYKSISLSLRIEGDLERSFTLEPSTFVADEVVVKAIRAGEKAPFAQSHWC